MSATPYKSLRRLAFVTYRGKLCAVWGAQYHTDNSLLPSWVRAERTGTVYTLSWRKGRQLVTKTLFARLTKPLARAAFMAKEGGKVAWRGRV